MIIKGEISNVHMNVNRREKDGFGINIVMSLSAGSTASTANVTVTGTMTFEASEVGKSFRMEIGIFGEDKSGDKLPAGDPVGDDLLYSFQWGFLLPRNRTSNSPS